VRCYGGEGLGGVGFGGGEEGHCWWWGEGWWKGWGEGGGEVGKRKLGSVSGGLFSSLLV